MLQPLEPSLHLLLLSDVSLGFYRLQQGVIEPSDYGSHAPVQPRVSYVLYYPLDIRLDQPNLPASGLRPTGPARVAAASTTTAGA
jgi:hypothetical protein